MLAIWEEVTHLQPTFLPERDYITFGSLLS